MDAAQVLDEYERWLTRQALADRTRSSYRRWVRELVARLATGGELDAFLAVDAEDDRRAVLGDWRRRLVDRGLAPSFRNVGPPLAPGVAAESEPERAEQLPLGERLQRDPGQLLDRALQVQMPLARIVPPRARVESSPGRCRAASSCPARSCDPERDGR